MKLAHGILASLLALAGAAHAAEPEPPRAYGVVGYREKLKIGSGCEGLAEVAEVAISMDIGDHWGAYFFATALSFSGTMLTTGKPGVWKLVFDSDSLAAYEAYLAHVASELCGIPVSIVAGQVETFLLKLGDDGTASVSLKTSATGTSAFGSARGKHQLKAKGTLTLDPGVP